MVGMKAGMIVTIKEDKIDRYKCFDTRTALEILSLTFKFARCKGLDMDGNMVITKIDTRDLKE